MDNCSDVQRTDYRIQRLNTYISDYLHIHKYLTEIPKKDINKLLTTYLKNYQQQKYNQVIFNSDPENKFKLIFVSSNKELFKLNGQLLSICCMDIQQEQDWSILIDILKLFTIFVKEEYHPNPIFINISILFKYLKSIDYDLKRISFDFNSPLTLSTIYLPIAMSSTSNRYTLVSATIDDPFILFLIKSTKKFVKTLSSKQKVIIGTSSEYMLKHISKDQKYLNIHHKELENVFNTKGLNIKGLNIPLVVKKDILTPKFIGTMEKKLKKANGKLVSQLWLLYKVVNNFITIKPVYYYKDTFVKFYTFRLYNKFICSLKESNK